MSRSSGIIVKKLSSLPLRRRLKLFEHHPLLNLSKQTSRFALLNLLLNLFCIFAQDSLKSSFSEDANICCKRQVSSADFQQTSTPNQSNSPAHLSNRSDSDALYRDIGRAYALLANSVAAALPRHSSTV